MRERYGWHRSQTPDYYFLRAFATVILRVPLARVAEPAAVFFLATVLVVFARATVERRAAVERAAVERAVVERAVVFLTVDFLAVVFFAGLLRVVVLREEADFVVAINFSFL